MFTPQPFAIGLVLDWIFNLRYFRPDKVIQGRTAVPFVRKDGAENTRLVLVLGENAGGKSFFRRLVHLAATKAKNGRRDGPFPVGRVIHLSMEARSMNGLTSAFIYGSEAWQSTGENSAHTVKGGITTASKETKDLVLYWDEPDIGMSEGSAAGAGIAIREFIKDAPPHVKAVFITTHSKAMVRQLTPLNPYYLYLGNADGPSTAEEWLSAPVVPVSLEDLAKESRKRFKDIQTLLDNGKK